KNLRAFVEEQGGCKHHLRCTEKDYSCHCREESYPSRPAISSRGLHRPPFSMARQGVFFFAAASCFKKSRTRRSAGSCSPFASIASKSAGMASSQSWPESLTLSPTYFL